MRQSNSTAGGPSGPGAIHPLLCACLLLGLLSAPGVAAEPTSPDLQALQWRLVGPFRGGRVDSVAGIAGDAHTFYFGGADGGVWKTTDAGHSWTNVSDCCLDTGAIGALAVAPSDPKVIYAGTGEGFPRGDMLTGDGLWKSVDAGKSWIHAGLAETHVISQIVVDPKDAQHLYVAALGHMFGPNPERGVFESRDGGAHWQRILFVDADTGVADLVMDASDPKTLYAALWQTERRPWNFSSGGAGSGIYKSNDGGAHWTDLSHNPGMPAGPLGRIGLALPITAPGRVYAVVEAGEGGLYRSDDGGAHWQRLYHKGDLNQRAWYFSRIYADTKDPDHLFVTEAPGLMVSKDGGKTFKNQHVIGGDHHVLWIDPTDAKVMILGNDGGATVSLDGGTSWSSLDNQPTGQFYHLNVDDRFPFHLYGAQQDRSTLETASATVDFDIEPQDWRTVAQWESGYAVPVPGKPWIVYSSGGPGGLLERTDTHSGLKTFLGPWPDGTTGRGAADLKYRFQWTFPIVVSRYAPDTLYIGSQYVMKSTDGGRSWNDISPDLTRDDKSKQQPSGGPLHKDITSVEYYDTVFALAESPLDPKLLWAGSDDGKLWATRDGGGHWDDVTPKDLPEWSTVNVIEASRYAPGTAYFAAHRYRLDDFTPYIYTTTDYGAHWRKIVSGLPADTTSFVVREDSRDPDLLFAGTLTGVYYSADGGAFWRPLQQNLPRAAIFDLAVVPQQDALAVATHGRAFWVLDNLQPLRELTPAALAAPAFLFTPQTAWLTGGQQDPDSVKYNAGENPANGVSIFYELKRALPKDAPLTLTISDQEGKPVASFSRVARNKDDDNKDADADSAPPGLSADTGMNLFVWDLSSAALGEGSQAVPGPQVPPGHYRATLSGAGVSESRDFEVRVDPRANVSQADMETSYALLREIQVKLAAIGKAAERIHALREELQKRQKDPAAASRLAELEKISAILVTPDYDGYLQSLAYPASLQDRLGSLSFVIEGDYAQPSPGDYALWQMLSSETDTELQALHAFDDIVTHDITALKARPSPFKTAREEDDDRD